MNLDTRLTSFSTRPHFHCGIVEVFWFGENVNFASEFVLLNNIVANCTCKER